eukprot:403352022
MLPQYSREQYKEKLRKIQQSNEDCRKVFFKLEDDLTTNVIKKQKIGRIYDEENQNNQKYSYQDQPGDLKSGQEKKNTIRSKLLYGIDDLNEQEDQLKRIKVMGEEAYIFMKDANATIYRDREGLYRMVSNQDRLSRDIDEAHGVIIGIERAQFIKKCLLHATMWLLTIAIGLVLFYKIFY